MANESIMQAFDRFTAHVLTLLENMRKENSDTYATKEYVIENGSKIDKVLVNGTEQTIGTDKSINIDLENYATKSFVDINGGKIDKILINGEEQPITNKGVDIEIPGSSLSTNTEPVYVTGVKEDNGEAYYNKSVYFNPSTGEMYATAINADKVYGPVWNDYAEWFEKQDIDEEFEPGDICAWDKDGVVKADISKHKVIIGVYSNTYGHILGGENLKDMESNLEKFVPIGLVGRVKVKVLGIVKVGDYIIASTNSGIGIVNNCADSKYIIGQALESKDSFAIDEVTIIIK